MKELKELQEQMKNSKGPTVEARIVGDDLRHWKGKIFGPVSIGSMNYTVRLSLTRN